MSGMVFPSSLAGFGIKVEREGDFDVTVQQSLSRKELRFTRETYPVTKYRVGFDVLRSDSSLATRVRELYQPLTHMARHFGQLDSFLLTDPSDSSVTDHGFAVGDGVTTAFQLQRTLGGAVTDAAGATFNAATKPYTNLVKNSSFETDSNGDGLADSWTVFNGTPSTEPTTSTIVLGRLPGTKAQRVSWGTNSTGTKGVNQSSGGPAFVAGQWYTLSLFARASGTNIGKFIGLNWNSPLPNQVVAIACPALTSGWQRYVFQIFWNAGVSPLAQIAISISNINTGAFATSTTTFGDLDFDDVQVTTGQWGAADLQPLSTPAAATGTDTPAFWPAYADGYEPIYDLNGDATIYEDGTWMGRRQLYPYARTNLLPFSAAFDNAAWSKTGITVTANATTAPDGTATGDQLNEGVGAGNHFILENTSPAEVQGELRCYSVFLKANNLPNIRWRIGASGEGLNFNLSTGVIDGVIVGAGGTALASGVQTSPLWPGWYRIWFVKRVSATLGTGAVLDGCVDGTYATSYTGTSRTFYAWGAQCERVSNLNGPTPYILTPSSAAVTVTDYTLSSSGVFTPAATPASGTVYSWDGSYYRRVRFANRSMTAEQIVQTLWKVGSIEMVTAK